MLLGPRGTEDFSSWAAWRQGVLAPHLVKTDMGHGRFAWDTFGPSSTWETSLQNHGQSLEDLISFFFFLRMSTALVQILDEQPGSGVNRYNANLLGTQRQTRGLFLAKLLPSSSSSAGSPFCHLKNGDSHTSDHQNGLWVAWEFENPSGSYLILKVYVREFLMKRAMEQIH